MYIWGAMVVWSYLVDDVNGVKAKKLHVFGKAAWSVFALCGEAGRLEQHFPHNDAWAAHAPAFCIPVVTACIESL
jgi:hypothetical protein